MRTENPQSKHVEPDVHESVVEKGRRDQTVILALVHAESHESSALEIGLECEERPVTQRVAAEPKQRSTRVDREEHAHEAQTNQHLGGDWVEGHRAPNDFLGATVQTLRAVEPHRSLIHALSANGATAALAFHCTATVLVPIATCEL